MAAKRARFNIFAHTADLGIELRAPALSALFACAARALSTLLVAGKVRCGPIACARIEAADRETLLVDWLNELLYLHTVGGWAAARFRVELSGRASLRARIAGERLNPRRHRICREIKAATFHGLKLRRRRGLWSARIIFDL